jgi:hypothetical protein
MPGTTLWSTQTGDVAVSATGMAVLKAETPAAAAEAIEALPSDTPILSAAAITAIATLDPATATAEQIINALQAT